MKTALVLGGGGPVGVAWESGLVKGLVEAGLDLDRIETFVGTSAGAIVGVQLASGIMPDPERKPEPPAEQPDHPPYDAAGNDPAAMGQIFKLWAAMDRTTPTAAAEIGALARGQNRQSEPAWVHQITTAISVKDWPERDMRVVAVDTASGERRIFTRGSGVDVGRAVTASSSVPGIFPSVEIGGALYMDGQVHSCTNADVLAGDGFERVIIAMPSNSHTLSHVGAHAERMFEVERAALEAAGAAVHLRAPDAETAAQFGNMFAMDKMPLAFEIGLEAGEAWARDIL